MDSTTPTGGLPVVLPESAVADLLGITVKTLRNRRVIGDGPAVVRISGRTVVYLPQDVDAYLRSRRVVVVNDTAATPIVVGDSPAPIKRGRGRPKGSITRRQHGEG